MACDYNIRSKLFPGSSGGTLYYEGYSASFGGPYGSGGSTIPPAGGNTTIPYECVNVINPSGFIHGFYKFRLEGGNCDGTTSNKESYLQVLPPADAGDPIQAVFCNSQSGIESLNDRLNGETPGGEWTVNPSSQGTEADNALLNTAGDLDLDEFTTPGFYYFDYNADMQGVEGGFEETDCADCYDKSTVEVIITADPIAGTGGSFNSCVGCPIDLYDLLDNADPQGSWSQLSGPATGITGGYLGTVNPNSAGVRVFRYTVGSGSCTDSADVTLDTAAQPNAGSDGTLTVCEDNAEIDLYSIISGEQAGGFWYNNGPTPPAGTFDPIQGTYKPELGDGVPGSVVYDFRYKILIPGVINECSNACEDESQAEITVQEKGYAGENAAAQGCISDGFDINQIIADASNDPLTTGEMWFLGYDSNCGANNGSGTFIANGNPSQSYPPMTNFGPTLFVTGLSGQGCYQFMHYTPSQGAPCADMALVTIEITGCCNVDFDLNLVSGEICIANLTGCQGQPPDAAQWSYSQNGTNFTDIPGATGACHTPSQGPGVYALTITCGSCTETRYYDIIASCSVSANISESGGTLFSNPAGCSGAMSFTWQYSPDGLGGWTNVATTENYTPSTNGHYKVIVSCPDGNGCSAIDTYHYTAGCSMTASLSESNGVLTASQTGGTGPFNYEWYYSPTGANGTWTLISGANGSTYTPTQSGYFQVVITDSQNCTDFAEIQFNVPSCNLTVSLDELPNGDLQLSYGGNQNTVSIRWQYSATGTGWVGLPQFDDQVTITPDQGNGFYRVLVWDGPVGSNCFGQDTEEWTSGCGGSAVISQSSCGNNTVDVIFLLDESVSVDSGEWASMKSNIDATIDALNALTTVDARYAVVQWSGPGQQTLAVPFTSDPVVAKNFSRQYSGQTDMSDATAWLYGELQANNINFRAGAARHLLYFTDGVETDNNCSGANGNFRKCDGGTLVYVDYDLMDSTYNTTHSVVRYLNGFPGQDDPSNAVCAAIADVGGDWNGDVDIPNDPSALRPRRLYSLSFGDPVPGLPYDITCTELDSTVNGCSGSIIYDWQYRTGPGGNWNSLPGGGSSTIQVESPGEYRLVVDCGGCTYISNIITL